MLQARRGAQRSAAIPKPQPSSGKLSGAQIAKVRAVQTAQEAKDQKKRNAVIIHVPAESNPERPQIAALRAQLDLRAKLYSDPSLTLPPKIWMGDHGPSE